LQQHVAQAVSVPDSATQQAMKWLYENHGLRTEPSEAITAAALLSGKVRLDGEGDIVIILSGRNVDEEPFQNWIAVT
jgi:threonine dehydratase